MKNTITLIENIYVNSLESHYRFITVYTEIHSFLLTEKNISFFLEHLIKIARYI